MTVDIDNETIELIKNKAELLLTSALNRNLVIIRDDFKKNTAKEYLPFMQKIWNLVTKQKGKIEHWDYVGLASVDDLYQCEYLITFSEGYSYMYIYIDRTTLELVRFDFTGEGRCKKELSGLQS